MIYWIMGVMATLIVILDQVTKYLVASGMSLGETIPVVSWLFDLHYVRNSGMAWSMFSGARWIFVALTVVILALVIYAIQKKWITGTVQLISVAAIIGGAIGNMIDRVLTGEVVDMIRVTFMDFPIFNVADCFISCGAVVLALDLIFGDMIRKRKNTEHAEEKHHDLDS